MNRFRVEWFCGVWLVLGLIWTHSAKAQHTFIFDPLDNRGDVMFTKIVLSANGKDMEIYGNWLGANCPQIAKLWDREGGTLTLRSTETPTDLGGKNFKAKFTWSDPNATFPQWKWRIAVFSENEQGQKDEVDFSIEPGQRTTAGDLAINRAGHTQDPPQ